MARTSVSATLAISKTARRALGLSKAGSYALPKLPGAAGPIMTTWKTADRYDGAELRRFDGRAGAMDAYDLPSLGGSS